MLRDYFEVLNTAKLIESGAEEAWQIKEQKAKARPPNHGQGEQDQSRPYKRQRIATPNQSVSFQPPAKLCSYCGKNHGFAPCHRVTGVCFNCGKHGHLVKDCPVQQQKQLNANAQ